MLFSYLCFSVKWLFVPSKQHLLVSHMEDFSPQVVKPIRKWRMSFKICLTGRETEICSVCERIYVGEFDDLCVFKCIGLHKFMYQGPLLITLKWLMPLQFTYIVMKDGCECKFVSRNTSYVSVALSIVEIPLSNCTCYTWQLTCCPIGLSTSSQKFLQSKTVKLRVSGWGQPDMKAHSNGDNRLWSDEWRPVN